MNQLCRHRVHAKKHKRSGYPRIRSVQIMQWQRKCKWGNNIKLFSVWLSVYILSTHIGACNSKKYHIAPWNNYNTIVSTGICARFYVWLCVGNNNIQEKKSRKSKLKTNAKYRLVLLLQAFIFFSVFRSEVDDYVMQIARQIQTLGWWVWDHSV